MKEDKTMKKTYSIPEMEIVQLCSVQHILSGSIPVNSAGDSVDAGDAAAPEFGIFEE